MLVIAAVRLVADRAGLPKGRLMRVRFLKLLGLIGMASQASAHWIWLQEAGCLSRMRIVAGDAFSLRPGMRDFRLLDVLGLIAMAGYAQRLRVGIGQNHFAVLRGRVAGIATLVRKWRMGKPRHQFRQRRLVRVMALRAARGGEGLPLMRFNQRFIFYVVASDAERGHAFGQVILELLFSFFADFMSGVAGVASHVKRCVAAAFFGDIRSLRVAS